MSEARHDQHTAAMGFLTVAEADAPADVGVRVLDRARHDAEEWRRRLLRHPDRG